MGSVTFTSANWNTAQTVTVTGVDDAIVDGNDVNTAKPDPEVFLIAAERLGVKPEDCIVVEDALAGIQAATAAGMTAVAIGDPNLLEGANYNLNSTEELTPDLAKQLI